MVYDVGSVVVPSSPPPAVPPLNAVAKRSVNAPASGGRRGCCPIQDANRSKGGPGILKLFDLSGKATDFLKGELLPRDLLVQQPALRPGKAFLLNDSVNLLDVILGAGNHFKVVNSVGSLGYLHAQRPMAAEVCGRKGKK